MPQTLREIREMLSSAGLSPQRRLGQNFLIDGNLMIKLCEAAAVRHQDVVLEVGAGTGSLTELLLARAGQVVAVEIDRGLVGLLASRLAGHAHLSLVHADVLASKSRVSPLVIQALTDARHRVVDNAGGAMLVANLPYHVSAPLLMGLLLCEIPFQRFCFAVQKEVADRITARPKTRDYGPLSIVLQACGEIMKLTRIPPQAFWPVPQVDSAALRIDIDSSGFSGPSELGAFIAMVRLAFSHRRKKLHRNLGQQYPAAVWQAACAAAEVDPQLRAEAIPVAGWMALFRALPRPDQHSFPSGSGYNKEDDTQA